MHLLIRAILVIAVLQVGQIHAQTCNNAIPESTPASRFVIYGDGTVTDNDTGLTWKRCAEGQTWNGTTCTGTAGIYTWQQALQQAVSVNSGWGYAGYNDWRVPNIKELGSIVERKCYGPATNETIFSSFYGWFWSASPHALYPDYAWGVDFYFGGDDAYLKSVNGDIRLVRGGQSFGPITLDHFNVSNNIPNQAANVTFPVTIEAILSNGIRDTSFNEKVTLWTNYNTSQNVLPTRKIDLVNGLATVDVAIDSAGENTRLIAEYFTVNGSSNPFDVQDPNAQLSSLEIHLVDANGNAFNAADTTVTIEDSDGNPAFPDFEGPQSGYFLFNALNADIYRITAVSSNAQMSGTSNVSVITSSVPLTINRTINMRSWLKPPVLILPGFIGSTIEGIGDYSNANGYPILTESFWTPASDLKIIDGYYDIFLLPFADIVEMGFAALEDELKSDFTPYRVPFDWRVSHEECPPLANCANSWWTYLIPAINHAKDPNDDGIIDFQKVNIVAHSTGGLLVRSYIQSQDYRGDIDRFAMVATPNMGVAKAYFMAQGGDPWQTDNLGGGCEIGAVYWDDTACTYSSTTGVLYKQIEGGEPFGESYDPGPAGLGQYRDSREIDPPMRLRLVDFYAENVPSGQQLLPTYNMLSTDGVPRKLLSAPNTFLEKLNAMQLTDYYTNSSQPASDKVRTKIFASNNVPTLGVINVTAPKQGPLPLHDLYVDGVPIGKPEPEADGDGTVAVCSAALLGAPDCDYSNAINENYDLGWSTLFISPRGKHFLLMGKFKSEIHQFLNGVP